MIKVYYIILMLFLLVGCSNSPARVTEIHVTDLSSYHGTVYACTTSCKELEIYRYFVYDEEGTTYSTRKELWRELEKGKTYSIVVLEENLNIVAADEIK